MPCHRQFGARRENAQPEVRPLLLRRQDERGFGKIHLVGDRLHDVGRQAPAIEKYRELISAEEPICKDVVVKIPV